MSERETNLESWSLRCASRTPVSHGLLELLSPHSLDQKRFDAVVLVPLLILSKSD